MQQLKDDIHLVIGSRVGENEQTRLIERGLELIGEGTRSVPSSNSMSTGVLSKLKNCPLTVRPSRLDNYVLRVLYSDNNPCSKLELFPCLSKVDNVNP